MKIQKKNFGGGGGSGKGGSGWLGGGQGGYERRIKVFVKIQKKNWGGVGGCQVGGGGVGLVGGWARVDVNAMLGVGGDVVYGGCEPRVEGQGSSWPRILGRSDFSLQKF